ncbi:hypothetical protein QBC43DRAFT_335530 [Cladorrhinum sp. PSN259]|nr:hypothetical protein QBC43DRAFT_335530 [Cladorrhinum sp. PSN259]
MPIEWRSIATPPKPVLSSSSIRNPNQANSVPGCGHEVTTSETSCKKGHPSTAQHHPFNEKGTISGRTKLDSRVLAPKKNTRALSAGRQNSNCQRCPASRDVPPFLARGCRIFCQSDGDNQDQLFIPCWSIRLFTFCGEVFNMVKDCLHGLRARSGTIPGLGAPPLASPQWTQDLNVTLSSVFWSKLADRRVLREPISAHPMFIVC